MDGHGEKKQQPEVKILGDYYGGEVRVSAPPEAEENAIFSTLKTQFQVDKSEKKKMEFK